MKTKITALALLMLAGTAAAQPASFTDLGNRTSTQNFTQDVMITSPTDIQWFRIELPAVSAVAGFVDIWTNAVGDMTDTEIGLYDAAGNGAGSAATFFDDDSGPGLFSQLTFGSTVERPNLGGAAARNGSDGSLAGGVYYLAVGRFNVNWAEGFGATGTYAGTQTTTQVQFDIGVATDPFPPQATAGTATPGSVTPGDSILYTVTVIPGGNPVSTGIVVTGDLSSLGGSGTAAFHDDGLNGDAAAGDGVYSLMYTVPAATAGGGYTVPVSVSDAQGRTASTSIATGVMNPANLGTISADQTFTTVVPPAFG
ncbi:MAG TPA: choice-of-anchor X domain-containing protein, partial [Phycisphaerales bacterium]|nr:choice-of-anchor X domain-containing protein [Phycisphaerales bacterium]